jgi:hypothetical protein
VEWVRVTLRGVLGAVFALEKYHRPLNYRAFPTAFQADDEGSIPFTRSNLLKHWRHLTDFV